MSPVDEVALAVATKLRIDECPHGLPYRVESVRPIGPYGEGATCRPLCDACVMAAVREVLGRWLWTSAKR